MILGIQSKLIFESTNAISPQMLDLYNMEPGKGPLEKEKNIYKPSIVAFHLSFSGVYFNLESRNIWTGSSSFPPISQGRKVWSPEKKHPKEYKPQKLKLLNKIKLTQMARIKTTDTLR